jgi:hypothetical protein
MKAAIAVCLVAGAAQSQPAPKQAVIETTAGTFVGIS